MRRVFLSLALLLTIGATCASAAVTFRSKSEVITTATGNTTVTEPASCAANDIEIGFLQTESTVTVTSPTGWTNLYGPVSNGSTYYSVSYIARGGSAPSLTWTFTSGGTSAYREVQVLCLTAGGATITLDSQSSSGTTGTGSLTANKPNPPATTAVASSSLAVCGGYHDDGSASAWTAPSGYAIRTRNTVGDDSVMATKSLSASGSEDPAAFGDGSNAASAPFWNGFTVTFTDVAGGGGCTDKAQQAFTGVGSCKGELQEPRR